MLHFESIGEVFYRHARSKRAIFTSIQPDRHQHVANTKSSTLDLDADTSTIKGLSNTIHATLCIVLRSPTPPRSKRDYSCAHYNQNDVNTRKTNHSTLYWAPNTFIAKAHSKNDQCYTLNRLEKSSTAMRGPNEPSLLQYNQTAINT